MLLKCCTQYASKCGKLNSGHKTRKCQFVFQSHRRAVAKKMSILLYSCAHLPCYQGISFIRALIPFLRALSSLPNRLSNAPPSNIITVGNRFQYVTLGMYRDVQFLWVLKDFGIREQLQKLTMKILWVLCTPSLKNNYPDWKVLPQSSQSIRESFRRKVRPELRACLGQSLSGQWGTI